jgi:hypothetical protein
MKFKQTFLIYLVSVWLILSFSEFRAEAGDLPGTTQYQGTTENGWSFTIVPFYAWLPGQRGTTGLLGTNTKLDLTPIDYLNNLSGFLDALDGLYMGAGELRRGDFGFLYDLYYMDIASSATIESDFTTGTVDVGFGQTMATLAGSYRVHQTKKGYFDMLAGLRIRDINLDVGVVLNLGSIISVTSTASDGDTWVDPIIGGKGRFNINENLYFSGWTLIGGFGAGSHFIWDAWGILGYQTKDWLDVFVGFRAEGTNYQSGAFIWDIIQYGPMLGVKFKL